MSSSVLCSSWGMMIGISGEASWRAVPWLWKRIEAIDFGSSHFLSDIAILIGSLG